MQTIAYIAFFTVLAGAGDALGFLHASKVWQLDEFRWMEAAKSAVAFQCGAVMYWLALRYLSHHGVVSVEVQTLFWFSATIIGVAALSGDCLRWARVDQCVAILVLSGVGWLLVRTADPSSRS